MSLEAIRDLRLRGQKPHGVVTVLIGLRPRAVDNESALVVVRSTDDPRFMDWRPLVGLPVLLLTRAGETAARALSVLGAIEGAGVRMVGAADETGTYPMVVGAGDDHHRVLRGMWEALCR